MKRYIYSLIILLGMTGLSACMDENAINKKGDTCEEGIPTVLSLSFAPNTPEIETRAGDNMDKESGNKVFDIKVYAFDKNGDLIRSELYNYNNAAETNGSVTGFKTLSGVNYIYGVANLSSANYMANQGLSSLESLLDASAEKGKETFLNQAAILTQHSVTLPDGRFLMSGCFVPQGSTSMDGKVEVSPGSKVLNGKIQLKRVVSSVTFTINNGSGVTFTPRTWQVMDIPLSSYLFGKDSDLSEPGYFSMPDPVSFSNLRTLTFYMMENHKKATSAIGKYNDRFKQKPSGSTYIILKGYYRGTADRYPDFNGSTAPETDVPAEGEVTYYIPLGNVGSIATGSSLQDYSTNRNTQYTYNITVNGINDIVVEVVKKDPTSVADGDIYYTGKTGEVITLDAHYEARVLKFTEEDFTQRKVGYMVKSPKTDFVFKTPETGAAEDKDWVKFVVNPVGSDAKVDYPGDGAVSLYTIQDLITNYDHLPFDEAGNLYVTAFVDEYYYEDMEWWKFANKPNREMLLLCRTATNKEDGNNSSLTESAYVLSQRSIQTYYMTDGSATYAVGIEWTNETNKFEKSKAFQNSASSNYYYNTNGIFSDNADGRLAMMTDIWGNNAQSPNTNWAKVAYLTDDLTQHKEAYTACMSRNRNTGEKSRNIQKEEVKWFLPSYQQYLSTVLGESGYAQEAFLFPRDMQHELHYYTSGCNILWSEEGMSFSFRHRNEYDKSYYHSVRCMRYLGSTDASGKDLNYVKITKSDNYVSVRLDELNNSAKRSKTTSELLVHTELDTNNKPYKAFMVYNTDTNASSGTNANWNQVNNLDKSNCPEGWRIPNQREMSIIMINKDAINNHYSASPIGEHYVTRSKYSRETAFDGASRSGFVYTSNYLSIDVGLAGTLRCVKDID